MKEEVFDYSGKEPVAKKYDIEACEVVYGVDIPEPDPILIINGVLVLSRGNISTIKPGSPF